MGNNVFFKSGHSLLRTMVFSLFICGLLFTSGQAARRSSIKTMQQMDRLRDGNADLKARLRETTNTNDADEKKAKKLGEENSALKLQVQQLQSAKDTQQAAIAALRRKIDQLEKANSLGMKQIKKLRKNPSGGQIRSAVSEDDIADDNEVAILSKPVYGVYLGERIDAMQKRFTIRENDGGAGSGIESWTVELNDPGFQKLRYSHSGGMFTNLL